MVSDSLVSTKLRPSREHPGLVPRPRLTDRLEREPGRRLTLLSAPAGFGKTTLLNEWFGRSANGGRSVAWVSLDEGDNDPVRFLSYLIAALRGTGEEGIGEGVLAALRSPEPPRMEAVLGALVNELATLPGEVAVVLDDYHTIDSESVHRVVTFLLKRLPESTHLVISGRVDPPLPLARLRARGQMTELHAADLRFTLDEAAAFLRDVMGLDLSADDVSALEGITEGWIAALQLAALSMRERKDVSGFIRSFSGSHRDVFDFLAEEVLERQTEQVQAFLLETSILDSLSDPLCDAVTGRNDGQRMLERLERENLLVVPLDDERVWYRYHHLFADFLRGRLERERPEQLARLHLRASEWYEENAFVVEAVRHALSAPDYELAARLIGGGATQEAWSRGEVPTVLRWLKALPPETSRRRPRLLLQHAMALALTGRPDDAESLLDEIEREVEAAGDDGRFLSGFASAVRSWCSRLRGDTPRAVELARNALSLLPDEAGGLRAFAAVVLGDTLWTTGDLESANEALAESAGIGRSVGHVYSTLSAMTLQARVQAERGRLRDAVETLHRARRFAEEQGIERLPAAGAIHIGMGALLYERDDLDGAERALETGVGLAELTGNVTDL